jgi:nitroimidazol reductase NimA-like FMN-containing flavoprotein (pyridoxamine 5'-phosphate oxidase superfamily)
MQELVESRVRRLLHDEPVAHVAVLADGRPYVTPISFVWLDEALWFRTMPGRRLDALQADPRVSCEISRFDLETGAWESVILSGEAAVILETEQEERVMNEIRAKYRRITRSALQMPPDVVPELGTVVRVKPNHVSGRGSSRGLQGPDRPGRL